MSGKKAYLDLPGGVERPAGAAVCVWPGCLAAGIHPAPRSRDEIRRYHLMCTEHVRVFNRSWNYYRGMSDEEVEASIRSDVTWNRPSWPLGAADGCKNRWSRQDFETIEDPFGFLGDRERAGQASAPRPSPGQERALRILDLTSSVTMKEVKARYKTLVKRHHPDVNRGDKAAEERFKEIHQAYETMMSTLAG